MALDKKTAITNFLLVQNKSDIVSLHNNFCHRNGYTERIIYPMSDIDKIFNTPSDLLEQLRKVGRNFDIDCNYFIFTNNGEEISSRSYSVLNYGELAEYLIEWGDGECNFDITNFLIENFINYAYEFLNDRYTIEKIKEEVNGFNSDFLMEDWDDIIKEFSEVLTICPKCGTIIYNDAIVEFMYDNGTTQYKCDFCDKRFII